MDTGWYRNAVIYSLDVRTFQDSNGDGMGDLDGLTSRLDYLSSLGVTALWLLPILPSPLHDGGYDVTDYLSVADDVGGLPAFLRFIEAASERGLHVILDLPLNHTSVHHPWFQQARANRDSPFRDYYIWVDRPPANSPEQIVFRDGDSGPWTYDEEAKQFYLHRFYSEEPDLNHANPAVRAEILDILTFWLRLGVSGIRIDAAPYLSKKSEADPALHGEHSFLVQMHERVTAERPDAMLMAEADVKPAELSGYFADGRAMQMLFDFLMNNNFFLALAREEAESLVKVLGVLPRRPRLGQWANWVRNHDELDLERLTSHERTDVMNAFAPEENMRIYGRGIRRRLPPMIGNDRRRMELTYSLLFSLPGTPIIRYGEEIGMGDDLALPERNSVRTPMQWTPTENGGFSTADAADLFLPVIGDGPFGYPSVNVAQQHVDRDSFLARMRVFIAARRQAPEIGWEEPEILTTDHPSVLALRYGGESPLVVLHNLCGKRATARLGSCEEYEFLHDLLADRPYAPIDADSWKIRLNPYGYRWFRVRPPARRVTAESARAAQTSMADRPH